MVKPQIRIIGAIAILLMLGVSPLSVTYSFADSTQEENREFRGILTEKVIDGKLKVSHYTLPENLSEEDFVI